MTLQHSEGVRSLCAENTRYTHYVQEAVAFGFIWKFSALHTFLGWYLTPPQPRELEEYVYAASAEIRPRNKQ